MNMLKVPFLDGASMVNPLAELDALVSPQPIENEPWPLPGITPKVSFYLAFGINAIFLKFKVKEKHFKATYTNINDLVYKDSCVEFFIGFEDDDFYYNFEFNAIGTAYAAYGTPGKREVLEAELIRQIVVSASQRKVTGDELPFEWEINLAIPFKTFFHHHLTSLRGVVCRANFYKCGDEMPEPHYLCWNNVASDTPNFHLPQYFGQLNFD